MDETETKDATIARLADENMQALRLLSDKENEVIRKGQEYARLSTEMQAQRRAFESVVEILANALKD